MSCDLADLQRRFRDVVLGGKDEILAAHLHSDAMLPRRLDVYRDTAQGSLIDVLATVFPVVRRIVGAGVFTSLATPFIRSHPPQAPQLLSYGGDFSAFIAMDGVGARLPYLADVARLEWVRHKAYFSADAPLLDLTRVGAMSPTEMENLTLTLHPATQLVRSPFPIYRIWEVNQPEVADVPLVDMTVPENVLVSRPAHHVVTRMISTSDGIFVAAIDEGKTLGEAAAITAAQDIRFDLQAVLTQHFVNGTFCESF